MSIVDRPSPELKRSGEIKISSLVLPGGWRKRLDTMNVDGLRITLRRRGRLPAICIDTKREVVHGFHRVAAYMAEGLTRIPFEQYRYPDGIDRELDELEENYRRRRLSTEELNRAAARIGELIRAQMPETTGQNDAPTGTGVLRHEPPKARVHEVVAKAAGVSTRTVRRAEKKARDDVQKKENAAGGAAPEGQKPAVSRAPTIATWGVEGAPSELLADAERAQQLIDRADARLREAQTALAELAKLERYPSGLAQKVKKAVHDAAAQVRAARPTSTHAYCKGLPVGECYGCQNTGLGFEYERDQAPPELLIEGALAQIVADGQYVLVSEWQKRRARKPIPQPGPYHHPEPKVKLETREGSPFEDDDGVPL